MQMVCCICDLKTMNHSLKKHHLFINPIKMCATGNPLFIIFFKKVFIRPQKGVITISKHVSTLALKLASCFHELPHLLIVFLGI